MPGSGKRPLPAKVEAEVMALVGARSVGTRRQWLLDVLGEVTIDLLGKVETVGVAPWQTLSGPYGAVRLMPVEELLVERTFMAVVREPRDEEAWVAAKQLAAVCLGSGAVGLEQGGADRGGEGVWNCHGGAAAEKGGEP